MKLDDIGNEALSPSFEPGGRSSPLTSEAAGGSALRKSGCWRSPRSGEYFWIKSSVTPAMEAGLQIMYGSIEELLM